jgi:hypothetical protein
VLRRCSNLAMSHSGGGAVLTSLSDLSISMVKELDQLDTEYQYHHKDRVRECATPLLILSAS